MDTATPRTETELWLRPLALGDVPAIAQWHEQLQDLVLFDRRMPLPLSLDAMESEWRKIIVEPEPRKSYWFTVVNAHDEPIGITGLQDINYVHGDAIAAILIAEPQRRGGVGVRTGAMLLDIAFRQLRLARVTSYVRADNHRSLKLIRKLGFSEEGRIRNGWYSDGNRSDIVVIGVLEDEWTPHREKLMQCLDAGVRLTLGRGSSHHWSWPPAVHNARTSTTQPSPPVE